LGIPVPVVRKHLAHPLQPTLLLRPLKHPTSSISILYARRMDHYCEQIAHCIYQNVALPPFHLLTHIEPSVSRRPPFSVVLTAWLSITAPLASLSRPSCERTWTRRVSLIWRNTSEL